LSINTCMGIGTGDNIDWKEKGCNSGGGKSWTGNQILIPEIGLDLIGMAGIAVLMWVGIITLPLALIAILIFALLSYFLTKDVEQKIKSNIENLLSKLNIPVELAKKLTNIILDIIGILIVFVVGYIIYLEEK